MSISIRQAASCAAVLLLACASGAASADEAKPKTSSPRQCFSASSVSGFSAVDDRTVNLRVGVKDVYQLELFSPCGDIDWSNRIAIQARNGSWICSGMDATVIAPSALGPQRCLVRNVRKLSPEEVAALPGKAKP